MAIHCSTPNVVDAGHGLEKGYATGQNHEDKGKNLGENLGTAVKILRGGPLTFPIYKICTLLSTDYVDKAWRVAPPARRQALLDAALGASGRRS